MVGYTSPKKILLIVSLATPSGSSCNIFDMSCGDRRNMTPRYHIQPAEIWSVSNQKAKDLVLIPHHNHLLGGESTCKVGKKPWVESSWLLAAQCVLITSKWNKSWEERTQMTIIIAPVAGDIASTIPFLVVQGSAPSLLPRPLSIHTLPAPFCTFFLPLS